MTKGAGRPRPRDTADRDSNGSYDRIMAANDTHVMAGHVREHHEAIDALTAEEMLAPWSEEWFRARHWRAAPLVGACRDIWETSSAPAPLGPGDLP